MIDQSQIKKLIARIPALEQAMADSAATGKQGDMRELVREHASLKKVADHAEAFFRASQELSDHRELLASDDVDVELKELAASEVAQLEASLPRLEKAVLVALLPPDPDEGRNAVIELRAGTGGQEAALFAGDLFRMYGRCAEMRGWKINIIDASPGDIGGYKEVIFLVEGDNVFGQLQYEGGGHRVQRVPITESSGRIHTSAATVAVFPEAEPRDEIHIPAEDIRIDIFRSSGPGGQSVNTTDSAVRLTHLPTGITVQCQDEKSQHRNREKAMVVLKARILDMQRSEEAEKMGNKRRDMIGTGDRSERIRTYNFPQNRLTDHRINLTLYSLDRIMEGDMDELIETLRNHDLDIRLNHELKELAG